MAEKNKPPQHIAVILDGNGRWAKARNLSRSEGHRQGALNVDHLLDTCLELKIPYVSLYAFSTENWKRPATEIKSLFGILDEFIVKKLPRMLEKNIRLYISGDIRRLPKRSIKLIEEAKKKTQNGQALTANFCINYGSRDEILLSANQSFQKKLQNFLKKSAALNDNEKLHKLIKQMAATQINASEFASSLYTAGLPDVDIVIRTAGEQRLSNFLLYQSAYAEYFFLEKPWPEFTPDDLRNIVEKFSNRVRKFGGLK